MAEARNIVIVGAGGFGREVLDVIEAINAREHAWNVLGFVDDGDVDIAVIERRGVPFLGRPADVLDQTSCYTIGIGNGEVRRRIDELFAAAGWQAATLVHPSSTGGGDNRVGDGCIFTAGSRYTTNIDFGRHVHLNLNCTVGHDCVIGDGVSLFPACTISGNVTLGARVTVGTGANIIPGVTVGEGATIGAGSVVIRDVEPFSTVVGAPAKPVSRG